MRKIIRLTEHDLTRIVKRTIMELDKSTYDSASEIAKERGYSKLADRFKEHGKNFGLNSDKNQINLVIQKDGTEDSHSFEIVGAKEHEFGCDLKIETEDGKKHILNVIIKYEEDSSKYKFRQMYYNENYLTLPETRKDAKKLVKACNIDLSKVDIKSINYEDSDLPNPGFQKH